MTANPNRILILSEEQSVLQDISSDLELSGYIPLVGSCLNLEIENILRQKPDIIIFDLIPMEDNLIQVYEWLKGNPRLESQRPGMVVLTTYGNLARIKLTLEFDELLLTTCTPQEIAFRLKWLLWKNDKLDNKETIKVGELIIHVASYEVWMHNKKIDLTFKEYELLKYLASHRGRAFNRESLLNLIWGYDYYGGTRTVDVHIRRIRSKMGDEREDYIKTIRGVGYKFRE